MSLSDIKSQLYRTGDDENPGVPRPAVNQGPKGQIDGVVTQKKEDKWEEPKRGLSEKSKRYIKLSGIILGAIVFLGLLVFGILKYRAAGFSESRVEIAFSGPREVRSGQEVEWEINLKNNNRASLQKSVLKIGFPENFKPNRRADFRFEGDSNALVDIGEIPGQGERKIVFSGSAYNPKGALIYLKADLSYYPSNFNSQFVSKNQVGISVNSSPITLEITSPQSMVSGDAIVYEVKYRNLSNETLSRVKIEMEYPEGFVFSSSDVRPWEGNNIWLITDLGPGKEEKLSIGGKLSGNRDETKIAKVSIGSFLGSDFVVYNQETTSTKMAASPLTIFQTVNGEKELNISAGEVMRFEIVYKNEGNVGLRDLIVTERLESKALDYQSLELPGGAYDSSTHTITWKAADFPVLKNLEPGGSGSIKFSVNVKKDLPVESKDDKNFIVSSLARIDSPDVPTPIEMNKIISGNQMNIKVNSKLLFEVLGFYNDSKFANSGPIPPRVDQETTYVLHLRAGSVSNDLADAKVEAFLPTGVTMLPEKSPEDAALSFNSRTNSIVWNIGSIPSGTGVLSEQKEVAFKIRVKPSEDLLGQKMIILSKPVFSAKDVFTGEILSVKEEDKSTYLKEDQSITTRGEVAR